MVWGHCTIFLEYVIIVRTSFFGTSFASQMKLVELQLIQCYGWMRFVPVSQSKPTNPSGQAHVYPSCPCTTSPGFRLVHVPRPEQVSEAQKSISVCKTWQLSITILIIIIICENKIKCKLFHYFLQYHRLCSVSMIYLFWDYHILHELFW